MLLGLCGLGAWQAIVHPTPKSVSPQELARLRRIDAQRTYSDGDLAASTAKLTKVIQDGEHARDPKIQDEVTAAKLTLGYVYARKQNLALARQTFIQAAVTYKGTGQMDAAFGRADEQAVYQAAVCLQARHDVKGATKEYSDFMGQHPFSPLVYAVHRRLVLLHPSEREKYDVMLQSCVTKQEVRAREEMAKCGPRVLLKFLEIEGHSEGLTLEQLSKACKTTTQGTTLQDLCRALRSRGYLVQPMALNRIDFAKAKTPFFWLAGDHYLLVLRVEKSYAKVYDPLISTTSNQFLPEETDPNFQAAVLLPTTNSTTPQGKQS